MKRRPFFMSSFVCPVCKTDLQLPRPKSKQREKGHIKDLWCPICQKQRKFEERKQWEQVRTMSGEIVRE